MGLTQFRAGVGAATHLAAGGRGRRLGVAALALLCTFVLAACGRRQSWETTDVRDHLPDLRFTLATAGNPHLTANDFRGKVVLLYFGYTHCPDVCPLTLARLAGIVRGLGPDSARVRILFVSVDPKRDTPALADRYAKAFSPEAVGATGTPGQIETLARRYRVAYQAGPPNQDGSYEVMHGKGVYVFDGRGRVRLLLDEKDSPAAVTHDLRQILASS